MIALFICGVVLLFLGVAFMVISADEDQWGGVLFGFIAFAIGIAFMALALANESNPNIAKARKRVDSVCFPYQVRNLHRDGNSFIFNCANDPRLKIVRAK